jgi:long-chain-fatty-acid---luciferin-component ligase
MENKAVRMLEAAGYIPSRESWTPADEALYRFKELFRPPRKEAERLRFNAIRYSFHHWYSNSGWYHRYCNEFDVTPSSIKAPSDISKIPLISHRFFKTYLEGADFAKWIAQICIGERKQPNLTGSVPTLDDVIDAFGDVGVLVVYSSGTSGRFSFIPKDPLTFIRSQYMLGKGATEMLSRWYAPEAYAYYLGPNPSKSNIWVGKVVTLLDHMFKGAQYAFDRKITTQMVRISLGDVQGVIDKIKVFLLRLMNIISNTIPKVIDWLEVRERSGDKVLLAGAPFILQSVLSKLEKEGRTFDFGERGAVITGGGWKTHEDKKIPTREFRKGVERVLGIPEENNVDVYTMVESNWHAIQCPEGHYLHLPPSVVYPMVVDESFELVDYGESGRFAFIDPLANSYPGCIITGDVVTLHEQCPVCDRLGPVLEPEVRRASGEDIRGCAEEMRRLFGRETAELVHDFVCYPDRERVPFLLIQRED